MGEGDRGGSGGRELSLDDPLRGGGDASWGELELDRDGAGAGGTAPDPLTHGGGRVIGDPFDGFDASDLPGLELDSDALPGPPPWEPADGAPADGSGPVERSFAPPTDAAGGAEAASGPPRTSSPEGASDPGDSPPSPAEPTASRASEPGKEPDPPSAAEVAVLADYGPAPDGIFGAVPYAVLVLSRKRALQKALVDLRRLEETAAQDAREALVELGRALHARADALAPLKQLLSVCDDTGRVAGERTKEWEKSREAADAQRASLTAKIEQAETAAGPYRDRETKLATQMDVRENDLRRAKAKLQRVEIELRNLAHASQPDASKQQMLEAEREARRADVAKAQGHVDELAPQLAAARRELTVMLEAVNDLEKQRRAVDQARDRTERLHLSTAGEAEEQYHQAVHDLAEQALARGLADGVAPEAAKSARLMTSALRTRRHEVRLHEAALTAHDAAAFKKGAALLGAAGLVILAMLLFVILR